jgi:PilZ domain-containing protein
MGMDHRWGQRQATNVVVHVVATSGRAGAARVLNISLTGAYLETSVLLRLHSRVHLVPISPDNSAGGSNRIAANVVRHDALGVGLEWCEALTKGVQIDSLLAMLADGESGDARCAHQGGISLTHGRNGSAAA